MRSAQQVFDEVATHLLSQNKKSIIFSSLVSCAYRGPNGMKCAAGFLIPDELYTEKLELLGWRAIANPDAPYVSRETRKSLKEHASPLIAWIREQGLDAPEMVELVHELQLLHDREAPEGWPMKLRQLAIQFNLSDAVVAGERL